MTTILFPCPHCGRRASAAAADVGRSGPCAGCGRTITVPAPVESRYGGAHPAAPATDLRWVWRLQAGVGGAVLLGCCCLAALPAVSAARGRARHLTCDAHLQQIAQAFESYHEVYGCLPPAYLADEAGQPRHSWRVLILPYLGEQELYAQYDFDEPWDSPGNLAVAQRMPDCYGCPSSPQLGAAHTSYLAVVGAESAFPGAESFEYFRLVPGQQFPISDGTAEPADLSLVA